MARLKSIDQIKGEYFAKLVDLTDEMLQCRDTKHLWAGPTSFAHIDVEKMSHRQARRGAKKYVERVLTCTRCGMQRSDAFNLIENRYYVMLEKLSSTYKAPPGYQIAGLGAVAGRNDLVRGEMFRRELEAGNVEPVLEPQEAS